MQHSDPVKDAIQPLESMRAIAWKDGLFLTAALIEKVISQIKNETF